jgi:chromosome segregation protein
MSQLKTGQRLVSREGDLWRWDGFVAAAHAPTGAARRLAERARLVDIEAEIEQARADAVAKRQALENAETELKAASAAESAAREAVRTAQREANAAREQHANAEREINRHASRRSALDERRTRLTEDRTEATGAHEAAVAALGDLPSSAENEEKLATVRADMDGHRQLAAQVRAEAQALAREAELADRRVQAIVQSVPNGFAARTMPPRRYRQSRPALSKSRPSAPNLKTRRKFSPRSAAR